MLTIRMVADFLQQYAPLELAADWDNVGLLLGDAAAPVQRLMTCLTVTPASAAEASAEGAQLVVCHHPILFRPRQKLTAAEPEGRMLLELARAGIAVYSPHTAFDNTAGGINDILGRRLGLVEVGPLRPQEAARACKVVVFVPEADRNRVAEAMFAAGAGHIGHYSQCSFRLAGTGTFFGSEAARPTIGHKGRRQEVSEWRLEAVCPQARVEEVVAALRLAHSYEEPAVDVYSLWPAAAKQGSGRLGRLPQPTSLAELARLVKTQLQAKLVQLLGPPDRLLERLAIVCGAGGDFVNDAVGAQADALLTGEARFHDCLAAQSQGLALLLVGHYASERCGVEELAALLGKQWPQLHAWPSRCEGDPLVSC